MNKILTISCALALMGSMTSVRAALIDTDFTAYADYAAALADGWSQTTRNGRGDALLINANGLEAPGWKQSTFNKALAGTVDLSSDNTYTITYRQLTGSGNSARMFALTSAASSLVVGGSYDSDAGLYIGDADANVLTADTWYTFQTASSGMTEILKDDTVSGTYLGAGWQNYELVIAASSTGNDTITLNVTTDGGSTGDVVNGHVYSFASSAAFDGAGFMLEPTGTAFSSLTVIPEPATFGMIAAFGGVMLFVRRKLMM